MATTWDEWKQQWDASKVKDITDYVNKFKVDFVSDNAKSKMEARLPIGSKIFIYASYDTSKPLRTWIVKEYRKIEAGRYGGATGWLCMCEETDSQFTRRGFTPDLWSLGNVKLEIDIMIEDRQAANKPHGHEVVSIPKFYFYAKVD